RFLLV
ncbi:hypothetical protein D030_0568C, partial [Vibrio parahaemolyticus AQ3810]